METKRNLWSTRIPLLRAKKIRAKKRRAQTMTVQICTVQVCSRLKQEFQEILGSQQAIRSRTSGSASPRTEDLQVQRFYF